MSRRALLTGTAGGITGAITAAIGVVWGFVLPQFYNEIHIFAVDVSYYTTYLFNQPTQLWYEHVYPFIFLSPYLPSASLFGALSFVLSILLIATSILIGVGFLGTYKIGGGAMGVIGLILSVLGITSGALLIIMGNLTTGYTAAWMMMGESSYPLFPILIPNFSVIWIGFLVLGFTFFLLGWTGISVRKATAKPAASAVAGVLSIINALVFIGAILLISRFSYVDYSALVVFPIVGLIIGFGAMLVAFILWAWVFYSSRNL
ncbi:MAG: hypothetical protein WED07_02445 [Candidatus Freyarchaeum deiterrae]